ncbi:hypothetical protein M885DRAFT_527901 [Pelagophyceae sp. CCMP2097]|nr:hypothetical protein M885DRAFT_527901 [Pelagophyceae sp. CCMP2097]
MTARSDAARRASVSLQQRDEAARSRLGVERRNLAAAADAVQRERDNLVAAARATRQALSDRVVVAFRLQLAEELRSLGSAASWARGTGARPALSS